MKIERIVQLLRTLAEDQEGMCNQQLASAIVIKGQVISIGFNQDKSHPFASKYSRHPDAIYLHAETDAIYKAIKKVGKDALKKATLITVRIKADVQNSFFYGLAKPCPGCRKCIEDHSIKKIVYTCDSKHVAFVTECH